MTTRKQVDRGHPRTPKASKIDRTRPRPRQWRRGAIADLRQLDPPIVLVGIEGWNRLPLQDHPDRLLAVLVPEIIKKHRRQYVLHKSGKFC